MFPFRLLAVITLLGAAPALAAERSVLLGVGTENLVYDIDDSDAFFAYRQRLAERRIRALGARAQVSAMKAPARGVMPLPVANPVRFNRLVRAKIQRQREVIERQERIARQHADRLRAWAVSFERFARAAGQ